MRQRHLPFLTTDGKRLGIPEVGVPCRGITGMPDGGVALQAANHVLREHLIHVPHSLASHQLRAVRDRDSSALLSSMLKGIQTQICEFGSFGMAIHGNNAAVVVELVVRKGKARSEVKRRMQRSSPLVSRGRQAASSSDASTYPLHPSRRMSLRLPTGIPALAGQPGIPLPSTLECCSSVTRRGNSIVP